ncbi:MAG: hypothetical protein M1836_002775 [Candelina mexicana]|nr:MAG: hypothetical protein M1836_002775 [Candelina mexicana]
MTTSHATANTTTASTPTVTPPPKSTKERDAGIGIGVPVVAICSALLAWLLHKRHKKRDSRSIGDGISAEDGWDQGIEVAAEQGIDAEEQGKNKALPTTFAELEGKSYLEDTKSPVEMQ